jgi:hypothetical protein
MMKRIFSCFFLVLSLMMVNAQQEEVNSFQQSENQATGNANSLKGSVGDSQVQSAPGHPPGDEEIPIDNYLPILALMGATLIIYQLKSKKIKTL